MGLTNFNKIKRVDFKINTEDFEIKKIKEFPVNTEIHLRGFIPTKDAGFGDGVLFITDDCLISVPNRFRAKALEIMKDDEAVEQILNGVAYFKYSLVDTGKPNKAYNIEFIVKE